MLKKAQWEEIEHSLDEAGYMKGIERDAKRVSKTAEVFTHSFTIVEMLKLFPAETWKIGHPVQDSACGDGNFLVAALMAKMLDYENSGKQLTEEIKLEMLKDIRGVDIMKDNVKRTRSRLINTVGLKGVCKAWRITRDKILHGNSLAPTKRVLNKGGLRQRQTDGDLKRMRKAYENQQTLDHIGEVDE